MQIVSFGASLHHSCRYHWSEMNVTIKSAAKTRRTSAWFFGGLAGLLPAQTARAHASEQGFVLLLPTDVYISAGVACVVLTIVLLVVLPERVLLGLFRPVVFATQRYRENVQVLTSCLSFAVLLFSVVAGVAGSRDPLANPLPLLIWTVWWVGIVASQGVLGDLWRWLNPWTGPVSLTRKLLKADRILHLPAQLGYAGAILSFLMFVAILLADPAPADPARLARYVAGYWVFTYLALLVFGKRWMLRGDGFSVLMRNYASLGLFGRSKQKLAIGVNGWQALSRRPPRLGAAVFMLLMLGSGSFDGLNETFWWLHLLGINPLEFPGRSVVVVQNMAGLLVANTVLITTYMAAIFLGLRLSGTQTSLLRGFCLFAPSILPIALGYHIAHYFSSFLVEAQYVLATLTDPMDTGRDLLGLGTYYVTTGFFNSADSARVIWLTQAAAVVIGHVLAVMIAHVIALRHFGSNRRAALSQAPLALFMVFYTFFSLWLLASPRGM